LAGFSRTRGLEGPEGPFFAGALFLEAWRIVVLGDRDQRGGRRGKRNLGIDAVGAMMKGLAASALAQ